MIKHLILMFLLIFSAVNVTHAQPKLTLSETAACENSKTEVALDVQEFYDVAAFTLYVEIDTLALEYDTLINPNSQLSGGAVITSFVTWEIPTIIITWTSLTPANIETGTLFDLRFTYIEGDSPVSFASNCEIVLSDLTIVEDAMLNNGLVYPSISITGQPQPFTVLQNEEASFAVLQTGGTSFQWQENSSDSWEDIPENWPFSGVQTDQLSISEVPLAFDGNLYRCRVMIDDCEKISEDALLEVDPLTIDQSGSDVISGLFRVYPVPCYDVLNFESKQDLDAFRVQLTDLNGSVIIHRNFSAMSRGTEVRISLEGLEAGLYQLHIIRKTAHNRTVKVLKL